MQDATAPPATTPTPTRLLLSRWARSTGQAVAAWTAKTYALPDRTVASQVLMYRQLLHTPCKTGLKLSRPYQATIAQESVRHMPWWETTSRTDVTVTVVEGGNGRTVAAAAGETHSTTTTTTATTVVVVEDPATGQTTTTTTRRRVVGMQETGKMVISYDNLIARLWNHGTRTTQATNNSSSGSSTSPPPTETALANEPNVSTNNNDKNMVFGDSTIQTTTTDNNNHTETATDPHTPHGTDSVSSSSASPPPPIPHEFWVSQLGFQQPDPVTDFRSGGILSLAMMVWIVESCPHVYARFCEIPYATVDSTTTNKTEHAASVLPFAITSINVTDMMAKFLMLSKSTDRMDALLSQKPFWNMFSDPYALLACQELALDMLADVVEELVAVRRKTQNQQQQPNAATALPNPSTPTTTDDAQHRSSSLSSSPVPQLPCKKLVSVFDFTHILSVTENRVEHDLLGAGPLSVADLRRIHAGLRVKYQQQLQQKLDRIDRQQQQEQQKMKPTIVAESSPTTFDAPTNADSFAGITLNAAYDERNQGETPAPMHQQVFAQAATHMGATASGFWASTVMSKLKPNRSSAQEKTAQSTNGVHEESPPAATESIDFLEKPIGQTGVDSTTISSLLDFDPAPVTTVAPSSNAEFKDTSTVDVFANFLNGHDDDGDWVGSSRPISLGDANEIRNFSIGEDDDIGAFDSVDIQNDFPF